MEKRGDRDQRNRDRMEGNYQKQRDEVMSLGLRMKRKK